MDEEDEQEEKEELKEDQNEAFKELNVVSKDKILVEDMGQKVESAPID